jgi:hypothetical protein
VTCQQRDEAIEKEAAAALRLLAARGDSAAAPPAQDNASVVAAVVGFVVFVIVTVEIDREEADDRAARCFEAGDGWTRSGSTRTTAAVRTAGSQTLSGVGDFFRASCDLRLPGGPVLHPSPLQGPFL